MSTSDSPGPFAVEPDTRDSVDSFLREAAEIPDPSVTGEGLHWARLRVGHVLCDRFVVERLAGRGGMGVVYRAIDRTTGSPVALKITDRSGDGGVRFEQEARVLSELDHPAIVRYVAHGTTPHGEPFLAMEWLEGEDLAQRLERAGLSVPDALIVARRVAEGLDAAHARGLIHRDVKPSNVFLVGGDPARAKLLDFGIVRLRVSSAAATRRPMTRTGTILGTVGYMSPEQATADRALDPRTDVFALGCMLFECLTGQPVFAGAHVVAVLAKVLREEAPRLRQLRPDLPPTLDDLVARMLTKEAAGRPADGGAMLRELATLGDIAGGTPDPSVRPSSGLSGGEQRLVSVMLAMVSDEGDRVSEIVRGYGGDWARLANGALLVTLGGRSNTSEQVVAAAICAQELQGTFPSARIALATGRAQTTGLGPPGPVIDQAAALLATSTSSGIRIDEVTAGLLGERFEIQEEGKSFALVGKRSEGEPPRTLLGKPTPCVGREKELGLLDATLRECIDDSVARVVLMIGPAGQGKSRLRHEFLKRVREHGSVSLLTARADPVGAGSAFLLVRQLVRQAAGLREADPVAEQHARLLHYVADVCRVGDAVRVADFLGELIGLPSAEDASPQLAAARGNPQSMAAWLSRSFAEWLAAASASGPLLIVLEDLHWGDMPSVAYLRDGLQALAGRPLMLLALARPEVHEAFPDVWAGLEKQEVALGRLAPRAADRLVRAALGETISVDVVARIVERADGNAFFLEELIRRVAEGGGDSLPETVLALVASRLERLEPEARRIVRAASIFGEVFWQGAAAALLGADSDTVDLHAWMQTLARREIFVRAPDSRFPGELQYGFRHGLLREAAYAMLTVADQGTGHGLAGDWLERAGEQDALTMADHFERGGALARAVHWLNKASRTAYYAGNVEATIALADRGMRCGAEGELRGFLCGVKGGALAICGETQAAMELQREAMTLFPVGSTPWFRAAASCFTLGMFLGDLSVTAPVLQAIVQVPVLPEPSGPYGLAVFLTCLGLTCVGQFAFARSFLDRVEPIRGKDQDLDPEFAMYMHVARGFLGQAGGELASGLRQLSDARSIADRIGNGFGRGFGGLMSVGVLAQTGHCDRAEAAHRELLSFCEPRGLGAFSDWATAYIGHAKVSAGRAAEAVAPLSQLLGRRDRFMATYARASIAHALFWAGENDASAREATRSLEEGFAFPISQGIALGALALAELRRGRAKEALAAAERGLEADSLVPWPSSGSRLRLSRAEALAALGRTDEARATIREARDRVLRLAAPLDGEPELRRSFLTDMIANARTLQLANEWLSDGSS